MTLVSAQAVTLPHYARADLAEPDSFLLSNAPGVGSLPPTRKAGSGFVEYLTSLTARFVTDGTVITRVVHLDLKDDSGNVAASAYAPITQGKSETVTYSFMSTATAAWGIATVGAVIPLFSLPILPDWTVSVQVDNFQGGDSFTNVRGNASRFPTGGSAEPAEEPLRHLHALEPLDL